MRTLKDIILEKLSVDSIVVDKEFPIDDSINNIINILVQSKEAWIEEVESGWGEKNSFAFEIHYKKGINLKIDFLNKYEFIYELYNDSASISFNSTSTITEMDMEQMILRPKEFINMCMSNLKKNISKSKALATRYRKAYENKDRHSDWEKAVKEESWVEIWTKRLTKYENLLKSI